MTSHVMKPGRLLRGKYCGAIACGAAVCGAAKKVTQCKFFQKGVISKNILALLKRKICAKLTDSYSRFVFTVYCGYLSARKRASSRMVVLMLEQRYLPAAASSSATNSWARQTSST